MRWKHHPLLSLLFIISYHISTTIYLILSHLISSYIPPLFLFLFIYLSISFSSSFSLFLTIITLIYDISIFFLLSFFSFIKLFSFAHILVSIFFSTFPLPPSLSLPLYLVLNSTLTPYTSSQIEFERYDKKSN